MYACVRKSPQHPPKSASRKELKADSKDHHLGNQIQLSWEPKRTPPMPPPQVAPFFKGGFHWFRIGSSDLILFLFRQSIEVSPEQNPSKLLPHSREIAKKKKHFFDIFTLPKTKMISSNTTSCSIGNTSSIFIHAWNFPWSFVHFRWSCLKFLLKKMIQVEARKPASLCQAVWNLNGAQRIRNTVGWFKYPGSTHQLRER